MKKDCSIVIEGIKITGATTPEELVATGKFEKNYSAVIRRVRATEWIEAFGVKFLGNIEFDIDSIGICLYPELDIEMPEYPDPEVEKASFDICKTIIEDNFDNVVYEGKNLFHDAKVSATFSQGTISTTLVGFHTKSECTDGSLYIVINKE